MSHIYESSIERLRHKLISLVSERGDLTDPDVVELSQELDVLIVRAQRSFRAYQYTYGRLDGNFYAFPSM